MKRIVKVHICLRCNRLFCIETLSKYIWNDVKHTSKEHHINENVKTLRFKIEMKAPFIDR
jgi:hypothetical protein